MKKRGDYATPGDMNVEHLIPGHINPESRCNLLIEQAYRPLSTLKQVITDILKHDTSFAVCLFPVDNGALLVQKW